MKYYLLMFILFLAGCGYLDGEKNENMVLLAAHVVSISKSRPAKVVIAGHGSHRNTCVNSTAIISAKLKGNKIQLTAKKEVPIGFGGGCGDAETEIYGEDTLKLDVGEYIIVGKDIRGNEVEWGRLRIEPDAAYVDVELVDFSLIISPPSSSTSDHFHLKLGVDLYFYNEIYYFSECGEPEIKTDVNRAGGVVNIDMSRVVPITDTGCKIRVAPFEVDKRREDPSRKRTTYEPYNTEIELGTFTKGSYRMILNALPSNPHALACGM